MRTARRIHSCSAAVAAVGAAALLLSGCTTAPAPQTRIVVRVAASAHPAAYEVHLAQAEGSFRSMHRIRSGQTRTYAVPTGWVTVRIPGVCVVPAKNVGTTTVDVDSTDCTVA